MDNPDDIAGVLGAAFPNSSNFFLNYVIARAFMMNCFRLIMPHGAMWRWIGQMLFTAGTSVGHAATERYRAFILYPASIRYGREPGLVLLIFLIGAAYSVAAPLLTPFTLAYMCTAYVLWRYQMIYVCVRCYESGGLMWPLYFKMINWCMAMFVVLTCSILLMKKANVQGVLAFALLPILYLYNRWCSRHYGDKVHSMPLWLAHEAPRTEIDPLVYTPPALRPHARGWYFEYGKAWVRWGVPPYVG